MNKYLHISIGMANMIVNMILICLGGIFFGMDMLLYAVISLLVASYVIDKVTIGISDNKVFYIITDKPLDVQEYVNGKLRIKVSILGTACSQDALFMDFLSSTLLT